MCTHPAIVRRRDLALGDGKWSVYVSAITYALYNAYTRSNPPAWLIAAIATMHITTPEAQFITAWHITGQAWSATTTTPEWRIANALGRLFDKDITPMAYRPVANTWATSQHAILSTICMKWWRLLAPVERARLEADGHILPPAPPS